MNPKQTLKRFEIASEFAFIQESSAPTGVVALPATAALLSRAPVAKNTMPWSSSDVMGSRRDQLSTPQMCKRRMHGAFGKSGCVGNCTHTGADVAPLVSRGLTVKVQVNHKRGRLLIVSDQIAHEHIDHVIVDGNGAFETRHHGRMK